MVKSVSCKAQRDLILGHHQRMHSEVSDLKARAWAAQLQIRTYGLGMARRVEFLTHDISVHVPHHVNSKIPWYNLRAANASLKSNWGEVRPPICASRHFAWPSSVSFNTFTDLHPLADSLQI